MSLKAAHVVLAHHTPPIQYFLQPQESVVIRLRLTELLADSSFRRGKRVELMEVAQATGIHRTTLSKMINVRGYNATLSNIDALCKFFGCGIGDIATYVPDDEVPSSVTGEHTSVVTKN
jgi:putative transcriptional regulator